MVEITIPARADRLDGVLSFVESAVRSAGIDDKQRNNIKLAVEEVFVNIASYAYPSGEGGVMVRAETGANKIVLEFRDSGIRYDPLGADEPDVTLAARDRRIGGLGVHIVKKMMDSVKYRYEDGENILTIEKYIGGELCVHMTKKQAPVKDG